MSVLPNRKTALVFGSTGLTGRELTNLLLSDERYEKLVVFVRKSAGITHPKLIEIIDNLEDPEKIADNISGDDLFCCLGTTMKKAGSKKAFEWVDLELPSRIAEIACRNRVRKFLIVSSLGADPSSMTFYMRTKGILERKIQEIQFQQIYILRPSMLLGNRQEFRFLEKIGQIVFHAVSFLFIGRMRKYRAIDAKLVAKAMVKLANSSDSTMIIESDKIFEIAEEI